MNVRLQFVARASCVCIVACALVGLASAASEVEQISNPKPLAEELRAQLGSVAIINPPNASLWTMDPAAATNYTGIVRRRAARELAIEALEEIDPRVSPPFAVAGYIHGLAKPPAPADTADYTDAKKRDRAIITNALANLDSQRKFADLFAITAKKHGGRRVRVDSEPTLTAPIDATIENTIQTVRLKSQKKESYSVVLKVRTRVTAPSSGDVLYDEISTYESGAAALSDWASNHGEPVRALFKRGSQQLSARICAQVLPRGSPLERASRDTEASADQAPGMIVLNANPLHPRHIAQLGKVGVISTCSVPAITIQRALTKNEAARQVQATATEAVENVAKGDPFAYAIGAISSIPFSLAGQFHGWVAGLTENQLPRSDRALVKADRENKLQALLRNRFLAHATNATAHPIFEVPKPFPAGQEKEFSQMSSVMSGTLAWIPDGQTPQYYLRSQNADTVLEIEIINPVLNGNGEVNPPMRFSARVRATLWTVQDGLELASCELRHTSAPRKFAAWARDDAKLLREEIVPFTEGASAAIVQQMAIPAWRAEQPLLAATQKP